TVLDGGAAGAKLLMLPDGTRHGSLDAPELDDEAARHAEELMWGERSEQRGALFVDGVFPPPRLIIFGAVDIAEALVSVAHVSAMGSRKMQAQRHKRLLELGLTEEEMERLSAPIGLDLGAITPEETALSIMSEVVALRRGRSGGRLKFATKRIHKVGT